MERRLYHGMLGLMLVVLGSGGVHLATTGIHGSLSGLRFNQMVFVVVLSGSIPVTLLLMLPIRLILGGKGGGVFWIKYPSKTVEHESVDSPEQVAEQAKKRMEDLGFTLVQEDGVGTEKRLLLQKAKEPKVHGFTDHAFSGELLIRQESGRTHIVTTLVFQDIVVLDSGEQERLIGLAHYLSGATNDLKVAVLPFTMLCGVVIALLNLGLWSSVAGSQFLQSQQLSINLAAMGMIVIGGYPILSNRSENHGLLLGLLGLVAATLPLIAG